MNFADRLQAAIRAKGSPACVGFDPLIGQLPAELRAAADGDPAATAKALTAFGRGVIQAVAPLVPAIKINIAFFEPYYEHGIRAYHDLVGAAHQAGLVVIGDVKRADIGHTSTQYAIAQLDGSGAGVDPQTIPDAITVNPYFGIDGVQPFIDVARKHGRGLFVLVQTSNPSAAEVQGLVLPDGLTVCQHVARLVEKWACGDGFIGDYGYSSIGAVVSPRDLESTVRIRELMPHCVFLVPGFGAQGRTADEVAKCFKPDGTGAIVAASRSVIFACNEPAYRDIPDWREAVRTACADFVSAIRSVVG